MTYTYKTGGKNGVTNELQESQDRLALRTHNGRSLNEALFNDSSKELLEKYDMSFPRIGCIKFKQALRRKKIFDYYESIKIFVTWPHKKNNCP